MCSAKKFEYCDFEKMEAQEGKAKSTISFGDNILNAAMNASSSLLLEQSKDERLAAGINPPMKI
jgi:hypothetical protein